jgi:hypothetical protein
MPYSVEEEGTILRATFSGVMTGEDLHAFAVDIETLLATRDRVPNNLLDLRAVEPSRLSFNDLLSLAKLRETVKLPNPIRTAIVADSPTMTGFARMYQSLNQNPSVTIQVFTDVAAAERWLTAA